MHVPRRATGIEEEIWFSSSRISFTLGVVVQYQSSCAYMPPIHKDHNLYILGAGFSYDAGLPLISNFLECMGDSVAWLHENNRQQEAKAIEQVFDFRLKAAGTAYRSNIDVENIEELFSLAAASEGEAHTDYVTTAIAATLDFAQHTTNTQEVPLYGEFGQQLPQRWRAVDQHEGAVLGGYTHTCPLYHLYSGMLAGYFCEIQNTRNTVITFNYDTLIEDALHDLAIPFHYGLSEEAADLKDGAKCRLNNDANSIPILKLHGSVNWAHPLDVNARIAVYGNYHDVRISNGRLLLLPPTWRKAFGGHLMGVWNTALKSIEEATRIIIIGFSMPTTDTHFKYLLAAGLRDNISLRKIIFVNPGFRKEAERMRLVSNLANVLRPELTERQILITDGSTLGKFLFSRENWSLIHRPTGQNLRRICLTLDGALQHIQLNI